MESQLSSRMLTQGITRSFAAGDMPPININGTESDVINVQGLSLAGIFYPAGMASTLWTFDVSMDGETWFPLKVNSSTLDAVYAVVVNNNAGAVSFGTALYPWPFVRINPNQAETNIQVTCSVFPLR